MKWKGRVEKLWDKLEQKLATPISDGIHREQNWWRAKGWKSCVWHCSEPGFLHEVPQELPGAHVECRRIAYQVRTWFGKSHLLSRSWKIGEDLGLHETNVAQHILQKWWSIPFDLYSIASSGNRISWHIPMPIRPTSVTHVPESYHKQRQIRSRMCITKTDADSYANPSNMSVCAVNVILQLYRILENFACSLGDRLQTWNYHMCTVKWRRKYATPT